MSTDVTAFLAECAERIESLLKAFLPEGDVPLHAAMRYAALGGGKRIRPALAYATALALGRPLAQADHPACAVELIHCYSLVHDDMPCMDDDDLRRGRPTCHCAFDEATALLAGDALQSLAFSVLARTQAEAADIVRMTLLLGETSQHMAEGQAMDMAAEGRMIHLDELEVIHRGKTGALFQASVLLAARACHVDESRYQQLDQYARKVGLAFQIHDDVLDVIGEEARIGKRPGSDSDAGKSTFPALMGLEAAGERARMLVDEASASLVDFGPEAEALRVLAGFAIHRDH